MTAVDAAKLKNVTTQAIHKELKAKSLESYKNNNRVYFKHDTAVVRQVF
jgi:chromosome partitioning protein